MNALRFCLRRPLYVLLLFLALTTAAPADDKVASAEALAKGWAALIDAGKYDESYEIGGDMLRSKVDQERWGLVLRGIRAKWGPLVSRKETNQSYRPNGYQGLQGEFILVTFDTSFQKLRNGMELVVLRWEGGRWRGAGYNCGPKPSDDAMTPVPAAQTEIENTTTTKPIQQQPR